MKILVLFVAVGAASQAFAGPTGLAVMPIADILRHKEAYFQEGATGFEHQIDKGYAHFFAGQVGLFNVAEVGGDYDWNGNWVYNAKVQLLNEKNLNGKGAFSVGALNYQHGKGDWYGVGRFDGKGYRLHGGLWSNDEKRLMLGIDAPWKGATVSLEYLGGTGARCTACYQFNINYVPGLSLQLIGSVPMKKEDGFQHSAILTYGFRF